MPSTGQGIEDAVTKGPNSDLKELWSLWGDRDECNSRRESIHGALGEVTWTHRD